MPAKLFKGKFKKENFNGFEKIAVISIGKAAVPMVSAVLPLLKRKPDYVLLANKGHPLPTKEGVRRTQKIISVARSLGKKDLAIVLLSGGGSAMLVAPVPEITLQDKLKTTKSLLKCGATIQEINVIRKHLSQVKGGNLATLLYPATVWGFVISDVVWNDLSTIASGPLSPDPSTFADALKILKKYRIKPPKRVLAYLEKGLRNKKLETPKKQEKYSKKVTIKIVADHSTVVKKAMEKAKRMGLQVHTIDTPFTGEARKVARHVIMNARNDTRPHIFIASGETTVTCRGKGHGGRNQEFVLSGLQYLKPNQTLLSIGTDGVDGICPEKVAGAVGDSEILKKAKQKKIKIANFLKRNDSYTFFKKVSGQIKTGHTETNVGDLMLLLNA